MYSTRKAGRKPTGRRPTVACAAGCMVQRAFAMRIEPAAGAAGGVFRPWDAPSRDEATGSSRSRLERHGAPGSNGTALPARTARRSRLERHGAPGSKASVRGGCPHPPRKARYKVFTVHLGAALVLKVENGRGPLCLRGGVLWRPVAWAIVGGPDESGAGPRAKRRGFSGFSGTRTRRRSLREQVGRIGATSSIQEQPERR